MQTDRPIKTAAEDRFDRVSFARRVADVVRSRSDPSTLVIGIYGPWGDGKSSTLSLIKEALTTAQDVVQVEYNPWFFSSSTENLTRSFFLTLGDTLEKTGLFSRERIGGLLKKYGGMVPRLGAILRTAGDALSVTDLREVRGKVEDVLTRHKTRVAVFIDDIDRLDRTEIQALFKLIRLSADFPYVVYILAFDDEIVSAALGEAYEGGDAAAGRRFLEKIVQAPLHLPRANPEALRRMVFQAVETILTENKINLEEADAYAFANNFALSFQSLMTTPRQAKLYENAVRFAVPIMAGETHIVDVLLLEAVRTFAPALYLNIRDNPNLFLKKHDPRADDGQRFEALVEESFSRSQIPKAIGSAIRTHALERLFPRISHVGYGDEWDSIWAKDKLIRVASYFPRYFQYGIPTGDIADGTIEEVLKAAASSDSAAADRIFATVKSQVAYPTFIRKLRMHEDEVPAQAIVPLMSAIARAAQFIPREPSNMFTNWTTMQAAILTSHLAQKLPEPERRFEAIQIAIGDSTSFIYSASLLQWAGKYENKDKGESHGFLERDQISNLTDRIVEKLLASANGAALYRFLGDDTTKVLLPWSWFGDQERLRNNIEASINAEGLDGAEELIRVCCGRAWEMQSGIPHVSDVNRNVYETVARFADPELIMRILRARYGAKLDTPTFHPDRNVPIGERLAIQFAFVHQQPKTQDAPTHDDD